MKYQGDYMSELFGEKIFEFKKNKIKKLMKSYFEESKLKYQADVYRNLFKYSVEDMRDLFEQEVIKDLKKNYSKNEKYFSAIHKRIKEYLNTDNNIVIFQNGNESSLALTPNIETFKRLMEEYQYSEDIEKLKIKKVLTKENYNEDEFLKLFIDNDLLDVDKKLNTRYCDYSSMIKFGIINTENKEIPEIKKFTFENVKNLEIKLRDSLFGEKSTISCGKRTYTKSNFSINEDYSFNKILSNQSLYNQKGSVNYNTLLFFVPRNKSHFKQMGDMFKILNKKKEIFYDTEYNLIDLNEKDFKILLNKIWDKVQKKDLAGMQLAVKTYDFLIDNNCLLEIREIKKKYINIFADFLVENKRFLISEEFRNDERFMRHCYTEYEKIIPLLMEDNDILESGMVVSHQLCISFNKQNIPYNTDLLGEFMVLMDEESKEINIDVKYVNEDEIISFMFLSSYLDNEDVYKKIKKIINEIMIDLNNFATGTDFEFEDKFNRLYVRNIEAKLRAIKLEEKLDDKEEVRGAKKKI